MSLFLCVCLSVFLFVHVCVCARPSFLRIMFYLHLLRATAHSWWLAGIITRNAGGTSTINTRTTAAAGASSAQNLDTTCGAIRTAPGGTKCLGEYCDPDIGCTSNCGNCVFDTRRHSRRSSKHKKTAAQVF